MDFSTNMEEMATGKHLAALRFIKIIDRLMIKHHGVQARVAEATGCKPNQIHNWVTRERLGAHGATIEKVIRKLGINPEYLSDTSVKDPDYEDYLLSVRPLKKRVPDLRELAEPTTQEIPMTTSTEGILRDMNATDEERDELRAYIARFQVTLDSKFVHGFLIGLRQRKPPLRAGDDALNEQASEDDLEPDDEQ